MGLNQEIAHLEPAESRESAGLQSNNSPGTETLAPVATVGQGGEAGIAQSVEHAIENRGVTGSTPVSGTSPAAVSTKEQSRQETPTVSEDTHIGSAAAERPDCSFVGTGRGPYRSREERGCVGMTYDEIAAELGVTRQRVMQIERAALRKLREGFERVAR